MTSKMTYSGVDVIKVLAAIGVVAIHTQMPILNMLGRLGVPFFVIISSFFFFNHFYRLNNDIEQKLYLLKFLKRIGYLFLVWQVLYLPLAVKNTYGFFAKNGGVNALSVIKYIFDFLFRVSPTDINGWFPSWYLIAMIIGLPFFMLMYRFVKGNLVILGIIGLIFETYFILSSEFSFMTHLSNGYKAAFPRVFIYIYVGLLFVKYQNKFLMIKFKNIIICLISLIILFMLENFLVYKMGGLISSDETILTVPTSILLVMFSLKYNPNIKNTVVLRNFSTFLYCDQAWFIFILGHFIRLNSIFNDCISFILVIIFSFLVFKIYEYISVNTKWKFWNYMV